jgi:hypothetical protein
LVLKFLTLIAITYFLAPLDHEHDCVAFASWSWFLAPLDHEHDSWSSCLGHGS